MPVMKRTWHLAMALAFTVAASAAWADNGNIPASDSSADEAVYGGVHGLAISGDAGYYTYGMDDVNSRFNEQGGGSDINGGMGYGGSLSLGVTDRLAARVGIDYLFASRSSSEKIGSTTYNSTVNLPATMVFIGGEYVLLPMEILNLKLIGGYALVNIFNGDQTTDGSGSFDLGNITGSGSGFQVGLGLEVFLARGFSLEADLAYNYAKIYGATFAGSSADPGTVQTNGVVDYSGIVAKVAFNIYLFR